MSERRTAASISTGRSGPCALAKWPEARAISAALDISEHTVNIHVKNILSKLGVSGRTEAATVALRRGILHLE